MIAAIALPLLFLTDSIAASLTLDSVVVTATRTPKALKDVPVVTQVLSSEDIRKADAVNVEELLTQMMPGIEFGYAMNQEPALQMNGFGGSAILFLVDGERLSGETMDNVDYKRLSLAGIDHIEMVKGAASALYGANAVGGVVNLITKEPKKSRETTTHMRYSSAGNAFSRGQSLGFSGTKWSTLTTIQLDRSKAVELTSPFDTRSEMHQIFGGNSFQIGERLIFRPMEKWKFTARGSYYHRNNDRITYKDQYNDYTGGLKADYHFGAGHNLSLSYGYDQYDKTRKIDDHRTHDHDYSNRQHTLRLLYNINLGAHTLTIGGDYLNDYLKTYQFVGGGSRTQHSTDEFLQFDFNPTPMLNVVGSVRHDYFSASKVDAVTARLAAIVKWEHFSLRANYATGFRAPSLKELYMDFDMAGIWTIYGNPQLKPEKSRNLNLAVEWNGRIGKDAFNITALGSYNHYLRRITTMENADGLIYCNEDNIDAGGVEITARYASHTGLGVRLGYNYLTTSGNTLDTQYARPRKHSATWRIDYDRQLTKHYGLNIILSGRYLSKPDTQKNCDAAYQLWRFSLQQRLWDMAQVNFSIDNLLNYKPDVYYFNSPATPGRTWEVGLSFNIGNVLKHLRR